MDKISVIVPVYNVAHYLRQCLDSIINQTYRNLEIILVNDGSTDNSLTICQEYQDRDGRIRIINQANAGLSAARNTGIEAATGQYLTFVDSDDWLATEKALESLFNGLKQQKADIAIGSFDAFDYSINAYRLYTHSNSVSKYSVRQWFNTSFSKDIHNIYFVTSWGKLFKSVLLKYLRFPVGRISEDDFTTWQLYQLSLSIAFVDQAIYVYRLNRDSSISNSNNQTLLSPLSAAEQRITMDKLIHFPVGVEKWGYIERINHHIDNALQASQLNSYKQTIMKKQIIDKYN